MGREKKGTAKKEGRQKLNPLTSNSAINQHNHLQIQTCFPVSIEPEQQKFEAHLISNITMDPGNEEVARNRSV